MPNKDDVQREIEELANIAYHAIRAAKSYGQPINFNNSHLQRAEYALKKLLDRKQSPESRELTLKPGKLIPLTNEQFKQLCKLNTGTQQSPESKLVPLDENEIEIALETVGYLKTKAREMRHINTTQNGRFDERAIIIQKLIDGAKFGTQQSKLAPYNQLSPEMHEQRNILKNIMEKYINGSSCGKLGRYADIDRSAGEILMSGFRKFEYAQFGSPAVPSLEELRREIARKCRDEWGQIDLNRAAIAIHDLLSKPKDKGIGDE